MQGLGLEYCRDLVHSRGCRLLVIVSRSGSLAPWALGELSAAGCTVLSLAVSCADVAALQEAFSWVHEHLPVVEHFVHAAGASGLTLLSDMRQSDFHTVANVKVRLATSHACKHTPVTSTLCALSLPVVACP